MAETVNTNHNMAMSGSLRAGSDTPTFGAGRPQFSRLFEIFEWHPILCAVVIYGIDLVFVNAITVVTKTVAPVIQPPDLASLVIDSIVIAVVLTLIGWWRAIGFNSPAQWRELRLMIVPAIVMIVLPLIAGIQPIDPGTLLFLVIGYLLTGLREEALYRGILLRVLKPGGAIRAVFIASVMFGAAHLSNLLTRANPALVFAQVLGAFSSGFGFSVLRLRTNTLWILVAMHFFEDLLLHYTNLPPIPVNVVQSVVMLVLGVVLILRNRTALEEPR